MKNITVLFLSALLFACNSREPLVISASINGEQEHLPIETLAFGAFYGVVGRNQDFMAIRVTVSCIDSVVASHLHHAPASINGNIIVTLWTGEPARDPQRRFSLDIEITEDDFENEAATWTFDRFIDEILAGNVYVNVHTVKHRGGEVRGQLERFR